MAKKTVALPTDATEVAEKKYELGMRSTVVGTGGGKEVYYKQGPAGTDYHGKPELVLRKAKNPILPAAKQSSRRRALQGCKGKRGCEFAECATRAFGHIPTNLQKACAIGVARRGPPIPTPEERIAARQALIGLS